MVSIIDAHRATYGVEPICSMLPIVPSTYSEQKARQQDPSLVPDLVDRRFRASRPNELWVTDFSYVAPWAGFVYVAFVVDGFARRIMGWRASASTRTDLVLDALEQALWARPRSEKLVQHSDPGSQPGFNRSSQQRLSVRSVAFPRVPRREYAIR